MKRRIILSLGFVVLAFSPLNNLYACDDVVATCGNGEQRLLNYHYDPLAVKCVPMNNYANWTLGGLFEFCSTRGGVNYHSRIPNSGGTGGEILGG